MASEKTLAIRSEKEKEREARRASKAISQRELAAARDRQERGQVAAQFITSLARDVYARNVLHPDGGTAEEKLAFYTKQAHAAMDAAIAFVRASNAYDDRGMVPQDAPPIVPEQAPIDANGSPVDAQ